MGSFIEANETLEDRLPVFETDRLLSEDLKEVSKKELLSIHLPRDGPLFTKPVTIPIDGSSFDIDGVKYKLESNQITSSARLLLHDADAGEDEEDEGHFLKLSRPFDKQFALIRIDQIESHNDKQKDLKIKRAYTSVDQVKSMKRRWTVPGQFAFQTEEQKQKAIVTPPQSTKNIKKNTPNAVKSKKKRKLKSEDNEKSPKKPKSSKKEKKSSKKEKKLKKIKME